MNLQKNKSSFFLGFLLILFLNLNLITSIDSNYGEEIEKDGYTISRSKIDRSIKIETVFRDSILVENALPKDITVTFYVENDLLDFIEFENVSLLIPSMGSESAYFLIKGKELGVYTGNIGLRGDIEEKISVNLSIVETDLNPLLLMNIDLLRKSFVLGKPIKFKLNLNKLNREEVNNVSLYYSLVDENNNTYLLGNELINVSNSIQEIKIFDLPLEVQKGDYILKTTLLYDDETIIDTSPFVLKVAFMNIILFGFFPMWMLILIVSFFLLSLILFIFIKRHIESKKKYKMKLDLDTIPKKEDGFLYLGHIAEKKTLAYLDPNKLTTHSIVAGATGGGKSISAQVIIEEALMNNIAVIVFDPTAQWSGMLRKCDDKKMISYYSNFGLKESDARAFKGNVRQVKDARQIIDINKYMTPGQIQIFSLNKLDPKQMDTFVANVIRQVFKSDPKESPTLKVLVVFDEVHRLLSKFGGSGEGFLQIERGCREFRKWGIGIMLVSQVLNDFVGEIKANISTEVQMRTRDEGDLNRIKTKYGEEFLQSLVRASVGVGMFENPAYNHAQPYFINFRPILHSTRRLPDEELEKYNNYNDIFDDLEYQISQLEEEKIDTFDLKMELKLIKDKIMSGSFSVVEIYLEGLKPRIEKEWEKLGKKPKERKIELASEEEIKKSIEEAKKSREKFEKEQKKEDEKESGKKKVEEKLDEKEVAPLIFDNGIMVGSVKELRDYLPNMDDEIFKIHVNDEKNDISDWITNNFSKDEGEKYKSLKDKSEIIKVLMNFGKSPKKDVIEEKDKTVSKENNINNRDDKTKDKLKKKTLKKKDEKG